MFLTKVKYSCYAGTKPIDYYKWCSNLLYGSLDEFKRKHSKKLSKLLKKNNLTLDDFCTIRMFFNNKDFYLKV